MPLFSFLDILMDTLSLTLSESKPYRVLLFLSSIYYKYSAVSSEAFHFSLFSLEFNLSLYDGNISFFTNTRFFWIPVSLATNEKQSNLEQLLELLELKVLESQGRK